MRIAILAGAAAIVCGGCGAAADLPFGRPLPPDTLVALDTFRGGVIGGSCRLTIRHGGRVVIVTWPQRDAKNVKLPARTLERIRRSVAASDFPGLGSGDLRDASAESPGIRVAAEGRSLEYAYYGAPPPDSLRPLLGLLEEVQTQFGDPDGAGC